MYLRGMMEGSKYSVITTIIDIHLQLIVSLYLDFHRQPPEVPCVSAGYDGRLKV